MVDSQQKAELAIAHLTAHTIHHNVTLLPCNCNAASKSYFGRARRSTPCSAFHKEPTRAWPVKGTSRNFNLRLDPFTPLWSRTSLPYLYLYLFKHQHRKRRQRIIPPLVWAPLEHFSCRVPPQVQTFCQRYGMAKLRLLCRSLNVLFRLR